MYFSIIPELILFQTVLPDGAEVEAGQCEIAIAKGPRRISKLDEIFS
jgi:hypothetical protein